MESLREAVERAGHEPDFHAALAFALMFDAGAPLDLRITEARRSAKKAVALDKDSVRAICALALVEYEAGDAAEARKLALQALRLDEAHPLAKPTLARINRVRSMPKLAAAPSERVSESVEIDLSDLNEFEK